MTTPDAASLARARSTVLAALSEAYTRHTRQGFEPSAFGADVSPLVNAFAALTILEKEEASEPGAASRTDD
ncbi:hypothetical protein [Hansschlegelia sp.]|uniref:hypothetical protein n=1 Tax=Hansschlegelia sp. TaxID=2041892 RepID=UPI002BBF46E9|nr:hypothetical protein [Hansschlegelia sp.]HVI28655.1 hypothetical protein [Hansschlegelia sp.]